MADLFSYFHHIEVPLMQLGRLLCAHLIVSIKILGRKTEGNEFFPGRSLSSFIPIILFVQEEYKGKHSFHQIKGEEKEGGIFNFCLTSLLQSKFSKSGKEKVLWIGLQGKRAKSVTGLRRVKWKMYLHLSQFQLGE